MKENKKPTDPFMLQNRTGRPIGSSRPSSSPRGVGSTSMVSPPLQSFKTGTWQFRQSHIAILGLTRGTLFCLEMPSQVGLVHLTQPASPAWPGPHDTHSTTTTPVLPHKRPVSRAGKGVYLERVETIPPENGGIALQAGREHVARPPKFGGRNGHYRKRHTARPDEERGRERESPGLPLSV